jgi:hypothetical protein
MIGWKPPAELRSPLPRKIAPRVEICVFGILFPVLIFGLITYLRFSITTGSEITLALQQRGVETDGEITSVRPVRHEKPRIYYRYVAQSGADDSSSTFLDGWDTADHGPSGAQSVGTTVRVIYDPLHPSHSRLNTNGAVLHEDLETERRAERTNEFILFSLLFCCAIGALFWAALIYWRDGKLLRQGSFAGATVLGTKV